MNIREVKKNILEVTPTSSINALTRSLNNNFFCFRIIWLFFISSLFLGFLYLISLVETNSWAFYISCGVNLVILLGLLVYIGYKRGLFGVHFDVCHMSVKIIEVELSDFYTVWFGYSLDDKSETNLLKFVIKQSNFYPQKESNAEFFIEELYSVTYSKPFCKNQLYVYKEI